MQRRLAAILAADIVGYSRLMGQDEAGTLAALRSLRTELIDPLVAQHTGRVFKATGDGVLAEFPSVVNAVACAVDIQRGMTKRNADLPQDRVIQLRIGVNLGDVIIEDDDVFGDGVNVAARLEGLAPPGCVVVSAVVRESIGSRLTFEFVDMGEKPLKNIAQPIRVYRIEEPVPHQVQQKSHTAEAPASPSKPSIAVLPFTNMSGDADQEYFADGMVEDIITALSRFSALFVIARNSSFTYKGRAVDVKQVGRELGVRYVLEGSVRKAGNRVRITGQLIDSATGGHLWADRFDGDLADVFDLQDQVTGRVAGAIAPRLEKAEIERTKLKPTDSLDAYDYYLRGLSALHQWTTEANAEALINFTRAIELDPNFASAYGNAARCYIQRKAAGWVSDRFREISEARRLANQAARLGKDDAVALSTAGMALAFVVGDVGEGDALAEQALALNPNLAWAWMFSGWIKVWNGELDTGIERVTRAMSLSPQDTQSFAMKAGLAEAHFLAGRFDDALTWAEAAIREQPKFTIAICVAAASAALSNRPAKAARSIAQLHEVNPDFRISSLEGLVPIQRPEDLSRMLEGLRRAGLAE